MNSHRSKSKKLSLDEFVFSALSQLQVLQCNPRSIRRYQTVWRKLITFAQQQGYKGKLWEQLIVDFLAHHEIHSELPTESYRGCKRHAKYGLTLLWRYVRYGYFERGKQHVAKLTMPAAMQQSLHDLRGRTLPQPGHGDCTHAASWPAPRFPGEARRHAL